MSNAWIADGGPRMASGGADRSVEPSSPTRRTTRRGPPHVPLTARSLVPGIHLAKSASAPSFVTVRCGRDPSDATMAMLLPRASSSANTIDFPSGEKCGKSFLPGPDVTLLASPAGLPSATGTTQMFHSPPLPDAKATRVPSGSHDGDSSSAAVFVSCTAGPPANGTIHSVRWPSRTRKYTTHLPSGEHPRARRRALAGHQRLPAARGLPFPERHFPQARPARTPAGRFAEKTRCPAR